MSLCVEFVYVLGAPCVVIIVEPVVAVLTIKPPRPVNISTFEVVLELFVLRIDIIPSWCVVNIWIAWFIFGVGFVPALLIISEDSVSPCNDRVKCWLTPALLTT